MALIVISTLIDGVIQRLKDSNRSQAKIYQTIRASESILESLTDTQRGAASRNSCHTGM